MLSLAISPKARALSCIALGVASAAALASPGHAVQIQQDFAGVYAPANWTFTSDPALGDGSVDTSAAPASITITGSDNGNSTGFRNNVNTDFTIAAAASGPVSFNWSYSADDVDFYDGFGYLLNGSFTQIADNGSQGSGFSQFNVLTGDTFGFRVFSFDNILEPGIATISNFSAPDSAPAPVPGPLPLFGAGAAFGFSRRLRRRTTLANGPVSSASGSSDQL